MESKENSNEVTWGSACLLYARGELTVQEFIMSQRKGPNIGETLLRLAEKNIRLHEQSVQAEIGQTNIVGGGECVPLKPGRLGRVTQGIKHMFLRHPLQ